LESSIPCKGSDYFRVVAVVISCVWGRPPLMVKHFQQANNIIIIIIIIITFIFRRQTIGKSIRNSFIHNPEKCSLYKNLENKRHICTVVAVGRG
jgi:hypothetical protein